MKSGLELLQRVIAEEIPQRAMEPVGAGPHGNADLADSHPELGRIQRILKLELIHSFDGRDLAGKLKQRLVH